MIGISDLPKTFDFKFDFSNLLILQLRFAMNPNALLNSRLENILLSLKKAKLL